ncbi:TrmH family RNA methyltransferase [Miniphocaeibacter halophilus]|uniref:RNA methyltransferase n=1 Tax=Miniphocaeibacter halophilus TaxID=2931922 RepID=A0AC61MPP1_9FIRM|nr:RNA methyltransferase [Miniphocaeibacter halophilus]QQK07521.1 RNA methyltransferase [Miniphocaeibacter halophilus]
MIKRIESKDNKEFKKFKSLKTNTGRKKNNLFIIEGKKMLIEAFTSKVSIQNIIINEDFKDLTILKNRKESIIQLKNSLFNEITEMKNSEGILAICEFLSNKEIDLSKNLLVLDNIRDPGNMGTIIRTAESFGYNNILLINGCVNIYNHKVLRSSMGSIFRVNLKEIKLEDLNILKNTHLIYSMSLSDNAESIFNMTDIKKHAIIIGNEANGVDKEIIEISDKNIIIPISKNVESLNAAIAASVTMFYFNLISTVKEKKIDFN